MTKRTSSGDMALLCPPAKMPRVLLPPRSPQPEFVPSRAPSPTPSEGGPVAGKCVAILTSGGDSQGKVVCRRRDFS